MVLYSPFFEVTFSHGGVEIADLRLINWRRLRLIWTARVLMELMSKNLV